MPTPAERLTPDSTMDEIAEAIRRTISQLKREHYGEWSPKQEIAVAYSQARTATGKKLGHHSPEEPFEFDADFAERYEELREEDALYAARSEEEIVDALEIEAVAEAVETEAEAVGDVAEARAETIELDRIAAIEARLAAIEKTGKVIEPEEMAPEVPVVEVVPPVQVPPRRRHWMHNLPRWAW